MTFEMSTAEKIETIVLCHLQDGCTEGALGSLVRFDAGPAELPYPAGYRVTADGKTFIVRSGKHGWEVSFKAFTAIDSELYLAAREALNTGATRDVGTVAQALGLDR